jgi:hypothetical protein
MLINNDNGHLPSGQDGVSSLSMIVPNSNVNLWAIKSKTSPTRNSPEYSSM